VEAKKPSICKVRWASNGRASSKVATAAGAASLALLFTLLSPPRVSPPSLPALGGPAPRGEVLRSPSVERLADAFAARGYRLETVARDGEVPRLFLENLPPSLGRIDDVDTVKSLFLRGILPMVLQVNDVIREQRERLLALERRVGAGEALGEHDRAWLDRLRRRYRAEEGGLAALKARVDVIPPALALAQAAVESDWGRSRFAIVGNALFGQWTFSRDRGLKPQDAGEGSHHRVKHFARLMDSVADYAMNLNTHAAYAPFRRQRAAMRLSGQPLDAYTLAGKLSLYSERRGEYVSTLRRVIRDNALSRLREARLLAPS
jgi:Bax protein